MKNVFKNHKKCAEISERVTDYLTYTKDRELTKTEQEAKPKDEKMVEYERIDQMCEFVQCYPLVVKKNKNASPGMDLVMMNAKTD